MTGNNIEDTRYNNTEVDKISCLPENLIDLIFEKLPVQDAVRTHVLSKSWRYKWTKMSSVVLDKHFSEKFAKNEAFGHYGFFTISNQIFNFIKGPILKLHLHIPNMALDSFQEVDQWILSLSKAGVIRELVLTVLNQRYQLPSIGKPIQGVERVNLASLLSNMPCLGDLIIDGYFLQFCIAENIPKWLPHPANCLEYLSLHNFKFGDLNQLQGVSCMLRNSPNLERLDFDNQGLQNEQLDVNPASTYLEASDSFEQLASQFDLIQNELKHSLHDIVL
ncbi:F-box protein At1g80960-like [Rutidosis leptorrhynchoides]|uniref:F-box protein At1g80960-like n=1 Tax=Rutidosis leptorrhynchoides TaxID=125765 RepID=UPI003A996903